MVIRLERGADLHMAQLLSPRVVHVYGDQEGCEWVNVSSGTHPPTLFGSPGQRAVKSSSEFDSWAKFGF